MTDEPFDHLVVYAMQSMDDEPQPSDPVHVVPPPHAALLAADSAPHLTEVTLEELLAEIDAALRGASGPEARAALTDLRGWVSAQERTAFLYQLEPASLAGDSTARARFL